MRLVLLLTALSPMASRAQGVSGSASADSGLGTAVARVNADQPRAVRLSSRVTGRVEGDRISLVGDSVFLHTGSEVHAMALSDVDSMWIQRGSAAPILGLIAAVPCAVFGGLVGSFIGGDPDSNGSPRRATGLLLIGMLGGGALCGSVGAGIGSLIRRWQLEYPHSPALLPD